MRLFREFKKSSGEIWSFFKSAGLGGVATAGDLLTLTLLVEGFGASSSVANIPSLLVGALIQFVGCRHLVFRGAQKGSIQRQLLGFSLVEAGALTMNALGFQLLVAFTPVPYLLARVTAGFLVYCGFSYPAWRRVFRSDLSSRVLQSEP